MPDVSKMSVSEMMESSQRSIHEGRVKEGLTIFKALSTHFIEEDDEMALQVTLKYGEIAERFGEAQHALHAFTEANELVDGRDPQIILSLSGALTSLNKDEEAIQLELRLLEDMEKAMRRKQVVFDAAYKTKKKEHAELLQLIPTTAVRALSLLGESRHYLQRHEASTKRILAMRVLDQRFPYHQQMFQVFFLS